jgi:flagellar basal body rod protein FlgC
MVLARNLANHQSTKHIRMKYHFIRKVIKLQEVKLQYTLTKEQVANALTKPLGRIKFPGFVSGMGMD